ncbi:hypothetical protein Acry_0701 [Acidiphilium cryptum JF-5]|uniref:Uncharacterized protein n=1 Tax=Acidiphilium cryptum (strain JF-5) TaxID=349163 RepID=A5FWE0_ACICJ|nr:hypothetical protein Acry_0701 [Acidiphilium cryptum JF-5]
MVFFQDIISFFINKFSEDGVLRIVRNPSFISDLNFLLKVNVCAVNFVKHVADSACKCDRARPMNAPAVEILLGLQHLKSDLTVCQDPSCCPRHRASIL